MKEWMLKTFFLEDSPKNIFSRKCGRGGRQIDFKYQLWKSLLAWLKLDDLPTTPIKIPRRGKNRRFCLLTSPKIMWLISDAVRMISLEFQNHGSWNGVICWVSFWIKSIKSVKVSVNLDLAITEEPHSEDCEMTYSWFGILVVMY